MRQTIRHVAKCHSGSGLVWVLRDGPTFQIVLLRGKGQGAPVKVGVKQGVQVPDIERSSELR